MSDPLSDEAILEMSVEEIRDLIAQLAAAQEREERLRGALEDLLIGRGGNPRAKAREVLAAPPTEAAEQPENVRLEVVEAARVRLEEAFSERGVVLDPWGVGVIASQMVDAIPSEVRHAGCPARGEPCCCTGRCHQWFRD